MAKVGEIAEFDSRDGFTPWQVKKLNANFGNMIGRLPSGDAIVEVKSVTTLPAGNDAYVKDVGYPPVALLEFGIPRGAKGDQGDKGDPGDPTDLIYIGSSAPDPRVNEILWYDTTDGTLSVWQLDNQVTPPEWKWIAL